MSNTLQNFFRSCFSLLHKPSAKLTPGLKFSEFSNLVTDYFPIFKMIILLFLLSDIL